LAISSSPSPVDEEDEKKGGKGERIAAASFLQMRGGKRKGKGGDRARPSAVTSESEVEKGEEKVMPFHL